MGNQQLDNNIFSNFFNNFSNFSFEDFSIIENFTCIEINLPVYLGWVWTFIIIKLFLFIPLSYLLNFIKSSEHNCKCLHKCTSNFLTANLIFTVNFKFSGCLIKISISVLNQLKTQKRMTCYFSLQFILLKMTIKTWLCAWLCLCNKITEALDIEG